MSFPQTQTSSFFIQSYSYFLIKALFFQDFSGKCRMQRSLNLQASIYYFLANFPSVPELLTLWTGMHVFTQGKGGGDIYGFTHKQVLIYSVLSLLPCVNSLTQPAVDLVTSWIFSPLLWTFQKNPLAFIGSLHSCRVVAIQRKCCCALWKTIFDFTKLVLWTSCSPPSLCGRVLAVDHFRERWLAGARTTRRRQNNQNNTDHNRSLFCYHSHIGRGGSWTGKVFILGSTHDSPHFF